MEPLVSVIVPVYNVLPFLREALDSVIHQTYQNLEIIIVDDGSNDGSGEVCDEYLSDPRVIVIHQENRGLSGARNTGLERMTGEYVAFMDSDDAFMPEMIEKMLDRIIQTDADITICGFHCCETTDRLDRFAARDQDKFSPGPEQILSVSEALNHLVSARIGWPVAWNKLYRKSLWNAIRFPDGCLYEDIQTMCPLFEKCTGIAAIPDPLMYYRVRENSITLSSSLQHLRDSLLCSTRVEAFIENRCPFVFTPETVQAYRERSAVSASSKYTALLRTGTSHKELDPYRKEIIQKWKKTEPRMLNKRSRMIRFLFLYASYLISPAYSCLQIVQPLRKKETV